MIQKQLQGIGVALVTPFTKDNQVDTVALIRIVNHLIEGGIDYLVVLGTTAETPTLSASEKQLVRETVVKANQGRLPLVLGIGGNNTEAVVNEIQQTDTSSFCAILSVVPYYNKPTQDGIYAHYTQIAKNSKLPIITYNVPGRTGISMAADTVNRLARDFDNIVAVKEGGGNSQLAMEIIKDKPQDFLYISGDDMFALASVYMGGSGVISVVGGAFPKEFSQMIHLGLQGEIQKANVLHYKLMSQISLAFREGNPVGIKAILAEKGLCNPYVRLPLVEASPSLKTDIKKHLF